MSDDNTYDLELVLADGSRVLVELVECVERLQAGGHRIEVSGNDVNVVPPLGDDSYELSLLEHDRSGLSALLALQHEAIH